MTSKRNLQHCEHTQGNKQHDTILLARFARERPALASLANAPPRSLRSRTPRARFARERSRSAVTPQRRRKRKKIKKIYFFL